MTGVSQVPVLTALQRNRWLWLLPAAAFVLSMLLLFGISRDPSGSLVVTTLVPESASGSIVIDGESFEFQPDPCVVGDDAFIGSGPGQTDRGMFHVSATPSLVELVFGIEDDTDTPPEDAAWWATQGPIEWTTDGGSMAAVVELFDRTNEDAVAVTADVHLSCG